MVFSGMVCAVLNIAYYALDALAPLTLVFVTALFLVHFGDLTFILRLGV